MSDKRKRPSLSRSVFSTEMSDKPKRPLTAFFLFMGDHRPQIKAENPELTVTQIPKKAAEMWRTVEDKGPWIERAGRLKEQYIQDLAEYNAQHRETDYGGRRKKRRISKK